MKIAELYDLFELYRKNTRLCRTNKDFEFALKKFKLMLEQTDAGKEISNLIDWSDED